jgi:hypothetical protein
MLLANKAIGTVAYLGGLPAVLEDFCWSWGQMIQFNTEALCDPGQYVHYDRARSSFHSFARNQLAHNMVGDWLLMLDTDHQFDPDLCIRLLDRLNAYEADVIVGLYQHRQHPHSPVLYLENENKLYAPIGDWGSEDGMEVFSPDSAGGGCLMVRRSVFDRIRDELGEGPFDLIPPLGEDHSFFRRCKRLGVKVICDPRIQCHHLQVRPVTLDDYDRNAVSFADRQYVPGFRLGEAV